MGTESLGMWRKGLGGLLVGALLVTACAPEDTFDDEDASEEPDAGSGEEPTDEGDPGAEGSPGVPEDEDDEADDVEPAIEAEDGFWRLNTLPEPVAEMVFEAPVEEADGETGSAKVEILSLDSDGDHARLVMAWLAPEEGPSLGSQTLMSHRRSDFNENRSVNRPFVRLVDREGEEALWPLHAGGEGVEDFDPAAPPAVSSDESVFEALNVDRWRDFCLCSQVMTDDEPEVDEPEQVELLYVDFPLPASGEIDVLAGQWGEPIRDVPVSEGEPFNDLENELAVFSMPPDAEAEGMESPPELYGTSARFEARVPLQARSRSLTGVTTTVEGDTQEVSLPADVLFDFGEYDLVGEAESIIEDAADKLNDEASGQTVVIEGHTDNVSGHDVNQPLSENRAQAVADAIEPLLDDGITIETEGYSFDRPLVPNEDAEGNAIEENQALNRRVGFRYTVVEESETVIELGEFEELEELPEAESVDPVEGAVAAFVIDPPQEEANQVQVQLDIYSVERHGDRAAFVFGLSDPDADGYNADAFSDSSGVEGHESFHVAPFLDSSDLRQVPHLTAASLVDAGAEREYFPVSMADMGCLCSESSALWTSLAVEPAPMFAEFELADDIEGPLILRVPDGGQIELPDELLEQFVAEGEG